MIKKCLNGGILGKFIFVLVGIWLLVGCAAYQGIYDIGLKSVEISGKANKKSNELRIKNFTYGKSEKYAYADEMIRVDWQYQGKFFTFTITNKMDHSIKILWDEAVYINENNSSMRVIHSGVKYTDANRPQAPTIIGAKSKIEELVLPVDNIAYYGVYAGWIITPLFLNRAYTQSDFNILSKKYVGKKVKVVLPLEIQGVVNEYIFTFEIENFVSK